jgi:hypothetical protein
MLKAFVLVLALVGMGAGAFYYSNPEVATKTFDEMTINAAKAVTDIQTKFNSK